MIKNFDILWENDDLWVINKPAGVLVNKIKGSVAASVQEWREKRQRLSINSETNDSLWQERGGVVHRLDKDTTGCLLLAKNLISLKILMDQFKKRIIKKEYLALVHGYLEPNAGIIRLPIGRSKARIKQEVNYLGKSAQTGWKVEKYLEGLSLVRLYPKTGRMHQIRVHLAFLGHPVFADKKYLDKNTLRNDEEILNHHFLHAEKIGFYDLKNEWIEVSSDLPEDMAKLVYN